jgi:hypothetical protein
MNMPHVQTCDVTECAYNKHRECYALAITVGDKTDAMCDTFWVSVYRLHLRYEHSVPPPPSLSKRILPFFSPPDFPMHPPCGVHWPPAPGRDHQ